MKTTSTIILAVALMVSSYFIGDGLKNRSTRATTIPDKITLEISPSSPIQISLSNAQLIPASIDLNVKSPGHGGGVYVTERKE